MQPMRLAQPHYVLEWCLALFAYPAKGSRITLLSRQVGLESLAFKCYAPLELGSTLTLELVVPEYTLTANGRVDQVCYAGEGRWEGIMTITLHPASERLLLAHLSRRSRFVQPDTDDSGPQPSVAPAYQS